ncbi:SulP family inorganic anion transporter [Microlunatus soli]|uniref:Sulfate permease, SulP family n=1 Tax=Microlunatus soli TaxID=630515 RepID=A0A1H1YXI1_9ACTN|nr:SulP family inorganic anion transporter [Microlunatus soli]SDT26255.1 sulfate permease, SulP family [Microlunatus soli]
MIHSDDSESGTGRSRVFQDRVDRAQDRLGRWLHTESRELKPGRHTMLRDLLAGLPGAISSVPDGMASGVLAGVNPAHGLYASLAGPTVGGLSSSTRMMVIATTGAAALAAGSAVADVPAANRSAAMTLLTLLVGAVLVLAAVIKLNRYIRYVSQSVMLGFLAGVSVNMVLGQLPDLLGTEATGAVPVLKAFSVVANLGAVSVASAVAGGGALFLLILIGRTKLAMLGSLVALLLPTLAVHLLHRSDVALVKQTGTIPQGLPVPHVPELSLFTPELLGGAAAVSALIIIQGAGVAEAVPNQDGSPSSIRRDVVSQGLANVGSSVIGGMPVGGSVGQTALNKAVGARTRWASIWTGIWMAAILLIFSGLVGEVAMPTLAAVLIYAGVTSIRPADLISAVRAGIISTIAIIATFIAVLMLPIAAAVGIGVIASLLLQLNQESLDLRLCQRRWDDQGHVIESPAPATIGAGQVLVLVPYGSLFFAGARTLQRRLPRPERNGPDGSGSVVILRLRGRTTLGATFLKVIGTYAHELQSVGGELYLTGVGHDLTDQWHIGEQSSLIAGISIYPATEEVGSSTRAALDDATRRSGGRQPDPAHRVSPDITNERPQAS